MKIPFNHIVYWVAFLAVFFLIVFIVSFIKDNISEMGELRKDVVTEFVSENATEVE